MHHQISMHHHRMILSYAGLARLYMMCVCSVYLPWRNQMMELMRQRAAHNRKRNLDRLASTIKCDHINILKRIYTLRLQRERERELTACGEHMEDTLLCPIRAINTWMPCNRRVWMQEVNLNIPSPFFQILFFNNCTFYHIKPFFFSLSLSPNNKISTLDLMCILIHRDYILCCLCVHIVFDR